MSRNVFIVGADPFNLAQLAGVRGAGDCRLHVLAGYDEIRGGKTFPVAQVLDRSRSTLRAFPDSIDGIIGWWDFPVCTMLPILRSEFGTPGASLESVLKCEHKYWSRIEQRACVPEFVPAFSVFDPFGNDPLTEIGLPFPFWIKPVKSASSYLAFRVRNEHELADALQIVRSEIDRLAVPFDHILGYARLPPHIAAVSGRHCIAEADIARGRQCTLEGYVYRGEVVIYGVFDSVRVGGGGSSFARYQYPSTLTARVQHRMADGTRRFLRHIGYDDAPFNVEYFWNPRDDTVQLLEVNTRISKSHCPLFKMVDGEYHHAVNLALGTGRRPEFPFRRGRHRVAAKFMLRHFRDARVARVPHADELDALRARFPDTEIELHVAPGMRLSELRNQDSYSFEVAVIFMGARDQTTLLRNYGRLVEMMNLVFEDDGGETPR